MYVLQIDELERRVGVEIQAAVAARAMGADVEVPDPTQVREQFDVWLESEPEGLKVDPVRATLMRALGLKGG